MKNGLRSLTRFTYLWCLCTQFFLEVHGADVVQFKSGSQQLSRPKYTYTQVLCVFVYLGIFMYPCNEF